MYTKSFFFFYFVFFPLCRYQKRQINDNIIFIFVSVISQYRTEEDLFKKEEKKMKLLKETIPFYLNKFEQIISENGSYTVGTTVSRYLARFDIKIFYIKINVC